MKRLIRLAAGLLAVMMLLAPAGCSGKKNPGTESTESAESTENTENTEKSGVLSDGIYYAAVTLTGGTGRASVSSPAKITVQDGKMTATIIWSSKNYDYMLVDGVRYDAEIKENHSVFEIPVAEFDKELPVIGDTTAMSTPHEIEYTLRFDSATLEPESGAAP